MQTPPPTACPAQSGGADPEGKDGFTLIELLTVMAIIAILAGLILSLASFSSKKAATSRADTEIHGIASACENYRSDNGNYPAIVVTGSSTVDPTKYSSTVPSDNLDPRTMQNSSTSYKGIAGGGNVTYAAASFELYVALTSDTNGTMQSTPGAKNYWPDMKPDIMGRNNPSSPVSAGNPVTFISDPFGNSYGYSTANNFYQSSITAGGVQPNTTGTGPGYNPTIDVWSTVGVIPTAGVDPTQQWIKNW